VQARNRSLHGAPPPRFILILNKERLFVLLLSMPKVSEAHSASQRAVILGAAVRCFAARGFHRSTMRDVIRESGMSAGALYLYFKSKDELIEAIAESRHRREGQWIDSAVSAGGDFRDCLHLLLRSFAKALADPRTEPERRLTLQLWAEALLDAKLHERVVAGIEGPTKLLTRFFKAAQLQGKLARSVNARALARVLIALYQGLLLQATWEPGMSLAPHLKVIDALLLGLMSPRAGDRV
jgi:AcrR family transcriptional regulator